MHLTGLSLPESITTVWRHVHVVLTFESMDNFLWCDHSNETSSAVLLHGTICFSILDKKKFGIFLEFLFLALLRVFRLTEYNKYIQIPFSTHILTAGNVCIWTFLGGNPQIRRTSVKNNFKCLSWSSNLDFSIVLCIKVVGQWFWGSILLAVFVLPFLLQLISRDSSLCKSVSGCLHLMKWDSKTKETKKTDLK